MILFQRQPFQTMLLTSIDMEQSEESVKSPMKFTVKAEAVTMLIGRLIENGFS